MNYEYIDIDKCLKDYYDYNKKLIEQKKKNKKQQDAFSEFLNNQKNKSEKESKEHK